MGSLESKCKHEIGEHLLHLLPRKDKPVSRNRTSNERCTSTQTEEKGYQGWTEGFFAEASFANDDTDEIALLAA